MSIWPSLPTGCNLCALVRFMLQPRKSRRNMYAYVPLGSVCLTGTAVRLTPAYAAMNFVETNIRITFLV
jgi:hypothetical protein